MLAAHLPGDSTIRLAEVARPVPGPGQVLLAMKASTICGSDLRAIYRQHLGEGPEAYAGVIAGHEPAGDVVATGDGVPDLAVGGLRLLQRDGIGLPSDQPVQQPGQPGPDRVHVPGGYPHPEILVSGTDTPTSEEDHARRSSAR